MYKIKMEVSLIFFLTSFFNKLNEIKNDLDRIFTKFEYENKYIYFYDKI